MRQPRVFSLFFFLVLAILVLGCTEKVDSSKTENKKHSSKKPVADLSEIKNRGVLRAMTTYSATSYFLYRGEPMGYEYELLERFADYLEVDLEIVVSDNIDSMFYHLNNGEIDLIAHGLTITQERKEDVSFSDYLYLVNQVLVQRKPENWRKMRWSRIERDLIKDPIELIEDTVSVRKNTSYFARIKNLSDEIGGEIHIDTLPGRLSTDEIIQMVVNGDIEYTIADNNIAAINASYYPILDITVPISFSQRIAWAVDKNSDELLTSMNEWIGEMKKETDYYVIYDKYFKNKRDFRRRVKSEFYSINNNRISEYDPLIQKYANEIGWDWRLLASLVYQESRFKPEASSWAEAEGLMQIMPSTAEELGIDDRSDPEQSISGGTRYLYQLYSNFEEVPDSLERIKFTMASFNAGLGHVEDARRLAEKRGLNPNVWERNVAEMILALSYPKSFNDPVVRHGYLRGIEPYTYISQIMERYRHYVQFINQDVESSLAFIE
ncbi:membrane-bound lytic murein transglycosylase MltF [Cryomorphaceae bacterium 1068]|nr:membrane-bound lytic murein transglycosylase MltF [Cryomorphaceae bacterium 1068]